MILLQDESQTQHCIASWWNIINSGIYAPQEICGQYNICPPLILSNGLDLELLCTQLTNESAGKRVLDRVDL